MHNIQPTFLGIGAHKGGTTWLYKQLINHTEIWLPPAKEIHYFDRSLSYPSPNYLATSSLLSRIIGRNSWERPRMMAGGRIIIRRMLRCKFKKALWHSKWFFGYYNDNWYRSLFDQAGFCKECGEITPSYSILHKDDVKRIKMLNADMKLIYMIRNPIERAWSAIRFNVDRGFLKINLDSGDEIISALKEPGIVMRGDYERTLDTYLAYFDSSQILVCFYEAIQHDPLGLMSAIATFLEIAPFEKTAINNKIRVNSSPEHIMPTSVRDFLIEYYAPMLTRLAGHLGSYALEWELERGGRGQRSLKNSSSSRLFPAIHP